MPQSVISNLLHCVFSTKNRHPFINSEIAIRLYPYFGGIAREYKIRLLAVGGMPDHVHLLLSMPSTISLARTMRLLKGNSSKWIHETFPDQRLFEWQRGYGAFSIGVSDLERTRFYIKNQEAHHQKRSFEKEYLAFLKKNGLNFDKRYVFD